MIKALISWPSGMRRFLKQLPPNFLRTTRMARRSPAPYQRLIAGHRGLNGLLRELISSNALAEVD